MVRIFRSKHPPPRHPAAAAPTPHLMKLSAPQSERKKKKQPIDYRGREGSQKGCRENTFAVSVSTSQRFHLVISAWHQGKKKKNPSSFSAAATPRLTVAGRGEGREREKERGESKYKIKAVLPRVFFLFFVALRDVTQVQATGWGDVMTAGF